MWVPRSPPLGGDSAHLQLYRFSRLCGASVNVDAPQGDNKSLSTKNERGLDLVPSPRTVHAHRIHATLAVRLGLAR